MWTEGLLFVIAVILLFIWAEISSCSDKLNKISISLMNILSKINFHLPKDYIVNLSDADKKELSVVVANFYKFLIENILKDTK